jgi:diaminopimelate dehydrogenase
MMRCRVAIIGPGKLGRACAQAMRDCAKLELAGSVGRGDHVRELRAVEVALVCVPTTVTLDVAGELLQQGFAVVEVRRSKGPRSRRTTPRSYALPHATTRARWSGRAGIRAC